MSLMYLRANLSLFDGEGGEGAQTGENPAAAAQGRKGEFANVVFGKQSQEPEGESGAAGQNEEKDRKKAFQDLIRGEYKDLYDSEVQGILNKRFAKVKETEQRVSDLEPIMQRLSQRYNTEDPLKIAEAIDNDDAWWEEKADEAGLSTETYKQLQKIERENQALKRERQQQEMQARADAQLAKWYQEAEELKQTFPQFDLQAEIQNDQFRALLQANVGVGAAYRVVHMDDIQSEIMKSTAAAAEKRVTDNIRAKGSRPREAGSSAGSALSVKDDVTKLTKAERAEIARRAARGETIIF